MSDEIDPGTFKAAMIAAGVRPTSDVTVPQWLDVWEGYSNRRNSRVKALVSGFTDLVKALRDRLLGLKTRERDAKAALAELDDLRRDAIAVGADDLRLQIASHRGHLESIAKWADFDARQVRRQATAQGIDLDERISQ